MTQSIKLEVFDPAMCCSTGVCGPDIDPRLPRFAADLEWLKSKGIEVVRYNLAQEPGAFVANESVRMALQSQGSGILPLIILNGEIVSRNAYPVRAQLAALVGLPIPAEPVAAEATPSGRSLNVLNT